MLPFVYRGSYVVRAALSRISCAWTYGAINHGGTKPSALCTTLQPTARLAMVLTLRTRSP